MQTFCLVGSFWAHTHLWQMQRLRCWWLTCWQLTRATPAASYPSCTSSTARPLMLTRYHPWRCYNIPRYALYAMVGCLTFPAALSSSRPCVHCCLHIHCTSMILQHTNTCCLNGLHQHGHMVMPELGITYIVDKQALILLLALHPTAADKAEGCIIPITRAFDGAGV